MLIFIFRLFSDTGGSSGSPLGKGILISGFPFLSGFGSTDVHKVYCVSGPTEAPGHPCAQQPGRLAHPAPIQGSWSVVTRTFFITTTFCLLASCETPRKVLHSFPEDRFLGGPARFCVDAVLFGSHLSFPCQIMFDLFQPRPPHFGGHMSQLLGLMAAASPELPLGLLYKRLFL